MGSSWVASDATSHTLDDKPFSPTSIVSVAVAVEDREEFGSEYREIVSSVCDEYDIPYERPVIKNGEINTHIGEWSRRAVRKELVEDLLGIGVLKNVHVTETTLGQPGDQVVPIFQTDDSSRRLASPQEVRDKIQPYYNLVSIWDYFEEIDKRFQHRNVLVDDFSGNDSLVWRKVGEESDQLNVVPKGDRVYPLLSLADLTMEYVKQQVDDWSDDEILNLLVEVTPDDSAFVQANSLDTVEDLRKMVPLSEKPADTEAHYPHPIVFIHAGGWHRREVESLDFYDLACEWACEQDGCVKFLNKENDREYMKGGDLIVDVDKTGDINHYSEFNHERQVEILKLEEAMERFTGD
ncbi:hypothetical protein [Halobaculum sp. MBLA0143]|uniref:hypothetical protein n=1 Tax=Halobaculum sp. MBLA0143 TaxID=3079933 RepID=UPI0035234674